MYTIRSAEWGNVKDLWEKWRTYDLVNPTPTLRLENRIKKVWIDPTDLFAPRVEKTLVLIDKDWADPSPDMDEIPDLVRNGITAEGKILGVLQIQDFSTIHPPLRVAGIKNVAVPHELRNNGIGRKLMEAADLYLKFLRYDLSMLYSSMYASQYRFYEKFGYERYDEEFLLDRPRRVHLKFYTNTGLTGAELSDLIKKAGKF